MVKSDIEKLVFDCKTSLTISRDLFVEIVQSVKENASVRVERDPFIVSDIRDVVDIKEKVSKISCMTIAILCADWEGLCKKNKAGKRRFI